MFRDRAARRNSCIAGPSSSPVPPRAGSAQSNHVTSSGSATGGSGRFRFTGLPDRPPSTSPAPPSHSGGTTPQDQKQRPMPTARRRMSFLPRVASEFTDSSTNRGLGGSGSGTNNKDDKNANIIYLQGRDRYQLVVMGGACTGKTAIIQRFLYDNFPLEHIATVEELHKGDYEIRGAGTVALDILDTSGSYAFPPMRRLAISKGDAFLLVYSINDRESFEEVRSLRDLILEIKGSDPAPPIVIVGNKSDLSPERRKIQREMAECECIDWDHGFVECSALEGENIYSVFQAMLLQAHLKGYLKKVSSGVPNQRPPVAISIQGNSGVGTPTAQRRKESIIGELKAGLLGTGDRPSTGQLGRRRSSLPVVELFHSTFGGGPSPLAQQHHPLGNSSSGKHSSGTSTGPLSGSTPTAAPAPRRKRSSCAVS